MRKLAFASFLLLFNILCINLSSLFIPSGLSFVRISLTSAIVIFTSLYCGPLYGAIVGGAGDILAILLRGQAGAINGFITVVYIFLGALPYFLAKLLKKENRLVGHIFLGLSLAAFVGLSIYAIYGTTLFDGYSESLTVWLEPTLASLIAILSLGCGIGIFFYQRSWEKKGIDSPYSPYRIYFIAFVSEIFLMVLMKSVAFYGFYAILGTPIPYVFILACLLLVCPVNLLVNTYAVTFLMNLMKKIDKKEEPKIDISELSPEEQEEYKSANKVGWGWYVFFAVMAAAIIACIIVINVL